MRVVSTSLFYYSFIILSLVNIMDPTDFGIALQNLGGWTPEPELSDNEPDQEAPASLPPLPSSSLK